MKRGGFILPASAQPRRAQVDTRTLLVEPPPVEAGWDACVEWANGLTLRLLQVPESPRVAALRDLLNAISTAKRVGTDVETALRAREQREGVSAVAARQPEPPEDDPMALPLWHAYALCRLAYDVASAAGITDQIASAYRARAKTHVAGLRVRELASTKALQERHKIPDLRRAVRDHAEVSAQMEREALDADLVTEAASSLIAFGHFMSREFKSPNHIQVVADALERVERGEIKRLVFNLPPRYGKSMLASQLFPSWYLGRHPDRDIICSANGQELAPSSHASCQSYIAGIIDYNDLFKSVGKTAPNVDFCLPPALTYADLQRIVLEFLQKNSNHKDSPASAAVVLALRNEFPCDGGYPDPTAADPTGITPDPSITTGAVLHTPAQ